jgi:hypothetical protein
MKTQRKKLHTRKCGEGEYSGEEKDERKETDTPNCERFVAKALPICNPVPLLNRLSLMVPSLRMIEGEL